mmetsp:Transcript_40293/g.35552  ORF Transcript_40293/g.35552 Transcript_40293/m.35552 type:complete len:97 (-) Transcript_40293:3-293(-)
MKAEWDKITDNVAKWMDEPHTAMDDFLKVFGEDSKLLNKIKEKRKEIISEIREKRDEIIHEHPGFTPFLNSKFLILCVIIAILAVVLFIAKTKNLI